MRERGIILQPWEVRAILDGRKQRLTRAITRVAGLGKVSEVGASTNLGYGVCMRDQRLRWNLFSIADLALLSPLGQPGDRLWGKETWATYANHDIRQPGTAFYAATEPKTATPDNPRWGGRWRSPVTMPRWASRILLEVTEVRVQRVQEITEEEAVAEGFTPRGSPVWSRTARCRFLENWVESHGRESWDRNDWVWVANVKRLEVDREAA